MRDFIKDLAEHQFFASCNFTNARYTFDQLAAQMSLIELVGEPTNVKNADLNKMYEREANFDSSSPKAKKIKRTLDYLLTAFPSKTPELERYSVVSLYVLFRTCSNATWYKTCMRIWLNGSLALSRTAGINTSYLSISVIPRLCSTKKRLEPISKFPTAVDPL
jgi:hypothetical protein